MQELVVDEDRQPTKTVPRTTGGRTNTYASRYHHNPLTPEPAAARELLPDGVHEQSEFTHRCNLVTAGHL